MADDLYSNPRRGERYCKCGQIKMLYEPFCGNNICRTLSRSIALAAKERYEVEKATEKMWELKKEREQKIEDLRLAKEKKILKQKERESQLIAERKKQFRLNTKALKGILQNAENKRDTEARTLLLLQKKRLSQSIIDKQIKKYQSAIRSVKKAEEDLLRHKKGR